MITSVLFVCTGNTCRSPMAEGLLKKFLKEKNQNHISVCSGGVMATDGIPASTGSILTMAEMGVDISSHKSTKIRSAMLRDADLILVMERYHRDAIVHMDATIKSKVKLLKEYINASPVEMDVEDPLGGSLEQYRACALELRECVKNLAQELVSKRNKL